MPMAGKFAMAGNDIVIHIKMSFSFDTKPGPSLIKEQGMNLLNRQSLFSALVCAAVFAPHAEAVILNEIRTDQSGSDTNEYVELKGSAGESLNGISLITIGDGTGGSGVIESVVSLSGRSIPSDGYFVIAESSFSLASRDLTTTLNFENSDNLTHLLVRNFSGFSGQDLDTNNDGRLDSQPWSSIIDAVAMAEQLNPPSNTEYEYASNLGYSVLGAVNGFVPVHIARSADSRQLWQIGAFGSFSRDTPGSSNRNLIVDGSTGGPSGYYNSVNASSSNSLRSSLHPVIDDHQWYPYSSSQTDTWDILELADEDPNNPSRVLDLYRNASYAKAGGGNNFYNREHTWPNSYGFPNLNNLNYPYTDTHMLYIADISYNSNRSSKVFAQCDSSCSELVTQVNDGMGGGSGLYSAQSNWTRGGSTTGDWQTWGGRKGDLARAVLYMDIRYEGGRHNVTNASEPNLILTDNRSLIQGTGSNASVAYMGLLTTLLQWHLEDPPDDRERLRNDVIESFQGNRNPFIDHPEWALCLFANQCN